MFGAQRILPPGLEVVNSELGTTSLEMDEIAPTADHWPFVPVLTRLGMAVALGIFIGLEREHSQKTGVRTFSLTALVCCLGGLMGAMYAAFALAFVGIGIGRFRRGALRAGAHVHADRGGDSDGDAARVEAVDFAIRGCGVRT